MRNCVIITTAIIFFSSNSNTATGFLSPPTSTTAITRIRGGENNKNKDFSSLIAKKEHNKYRKSNNIASVQTKMGSQALVYGSAVATTFGMQGLGFVAAYLLKTEKFYDIFGGL